jgi:tripartite-type tricarboxylate transporter receptor subunit TctC
MGYGMGKKFFCALVVTFVLSSFSLAYASPAQPEWPTKTITWIVPFSAGGNSDNISRIIAPYFSKELGVPINIVNQPGAAGEIGTMAIAEADPDGYTIGVINAPDIQISCIVNDAYDLDFFNDLNYLASYTATPISFYAPQNSEWNTLEKFVAYHKAHPNGLAFGEGGIGHRVLMATVMDYFDIQISSVNFNSVADVVAASLGGHIDAAGAGNQVISQFMAGGWAPIAWGGLEKCKQFPDTPLFSDMGLFTDFLGVMTVLLTPKEVPAYVNEKLIEIANKVSQIPEVRTQLEAIDCVYSFTSGAEMDKKMKDYYAEIEKICAQYKEVIVLNN